MIKSNSNSKTSPYELGLGEETNVYFPEFSMIINRGKPVRLGSNLKTFKEKVGFVLPRPGRFNFLYRNIRPLDKKETKTNGLIANKEYDLSFKGHFFSDAKFKGSWDVKFSEELPCKVLIFSLKGNALVFIPLDEKGNLMSICKLKSS